jgi:predicted transcriptional regulator
MARTRRDASTALTRRERQIMDIIYRLGRATASEVREEMIDPPSYSAVRALLRLLDEKGHVSHFNDGPRYVFVPTTSKSTAGQTALERLMATFFGGSVERLVSTLLDARSEELSETELDRIAAMVEAAKKEGR